MIVAGDDVFDAEPNESTQRSEVGTRRAIEDGGFSTRAQHRLADVVAKADADEVAMIGTRNLVERRDDLHSRDRFLKRVAKIEPEKMTVNDLVTLDGRADA